MAAGLGFKTFTTGEVLTAGDVNGYLMQGVLVFATAAARNSAITSPQEGQFAFTKDTNGLWYYDGAAWVASGATGDIEGVTAGTGISGGGTSGTVTVTNSMATAITTNGDILYGTGSGTFNRLGIGSSAQVLTVASGIPSWATPASGGGMTLLSTTAMTGSHSIAITGISQSYKKLVIIGYGISNNTGSTYTELLPNASTSSTYQHTAGTPNSGTFNTVSYDNDSIYVFPPTWYSLYTSTANAFTIEIDNYTSTTNYKTFTGRSVFVNSDSYNIGGFNSGGFRSNGAVSSITMKKTAGSSYAFNAGSVEIWGVS